MPTDKKGFRMDFELKTMEFDKETGRIKARRFIPNPNRYEKRRIKGKLCYFDKFNNLSFFWGSCSI